MGRVISVSLFYVGNVGAIIDRPPFAVAIRSQISTNTVIAKKGADWCGNPFLLQMEYLLGHDRTSISP